MMEDPSFIGKGDLSLRPPSHLGSDYSDEPNIIQITCSDAGYVPMTGTLRSWWNSNARNANDRQEQHGS